MSARQPVTAAERPPHRAARPIPPYPLRLQLEQLEPRLLLSADGLGLAPELVLPGAQPAPATIVAPSQSTDSARAAVVASRELVFIDPRVPDAQQLLAALVGDADPSRRFEVITLDTQRDGIVQVTAALKSRMQLDAVHFITHGSDGAIQLGGTVLDAKALCANTDLISAWGSALKDGADLLFYGCDLASTARGRALVDWIADLTGADVAASTDKTGSAAQGGDWELEYRVGQVDAEIVVTRAAQRAWNGLLATVAVTTTNDVLDGDTSSIANLLLTPGLDGKISLREAIIAANNTANAGGPDLIQFNISGIGPHTINVMDPDGAGPFAGLPTIVDPVIIDATTQPGFSGTPIIQLNGTNAGPGADGFSITAGGSTIRGFVINRFRGDGIDISGGGGNTIVGNWIGTNAAGTNASANSGVGIRLASGNNTVGGTSSGDRNVISGNSSAGVLIASAGNVVQGNRIGTDKDGNAAIANSQSGVLVTASGNTIGGTAVGAGNLVSGNAWSGVEFNGPGATGNVVLGNTMGLNAAGDTAIANGLSGVLLTGGAGGNTIGGTVAGAAQRLSGNGFQDRITGFASNGQPHPGELHRD